MFTLGNKEAIVNNTAKYPVTIAGTKMSIQGFGSFDQGQITSSVAQRFISSRVEAMDLTAPSAADLGIITGVNVPVTFGIRINTFRDDSEWATNYIKNGRPLVMEILVSSTDDSTAVGVKMVAAFDEYVAKFNYASGLPFTYSATAGVVSMTLKDYILMFQEYVEFRVNREITTVQATSTKMVDSGTEITTVTGTNNTFAVDTIGSLVVGDTISIASGEVTITAIVGLDITVSASIAFVQAETIYLKTTSIYPTYDGKYLEENVRMSLASTSDSYGISPDEKPLISGSYTAITFVVTDANLGGIDGSFQKHNFLGSTRGEVGGTREFKFTLYLLEGTDMFTTGAGNKVFDIVDFLVGATGETLLLGTGEIVTTAADFVA